MPYFGKLARDLRFGQEKQLVIDRVLPDVLLLRNSLEQTVVLLIIIDLQRIRCEGVWALDQMAVAF
jgi:hypothetical protein